MSDYRQTNIAGVLWHRFGLVEIENPRNGVPRISCSEQQIANVSGEEVARDVGTLRFDFDPNADFPILDPATNVVQNEAWFTSLPKGLQTYVLIYSYVLHQANLRDENT